MNKENQKKRTCRRKPSTFYLMPKEVKEKGKQIIKDNRHTNLELCYILKVDPEIYENVNISKLDFSSRLRSALTGEFNFEVYDLNLKSYRYEQHEGCKTVADVLHLTVHDMENIRDLGPDGRAEILIMTKKFIDEERNFNIRRNIYNDADIRPRRLGYALNCLMHGRDHTNISYNETEKSFVEKYKTAIELLDFDLCKAAFNGDKAVYDIIRALHIFSEPKIRYKSFIDKIDKKIRGLSDAIKQKYAKTLIIKYYINKNIKLQSDFLLNLDEYIKLIDLPRYMTKSEMGNRNTMLVLLSFLDWLALDDS